MLSVPEMTNMTTSNVTQLPIVYGVRSPLPVIENKKSCIQGPTRVKKTDTRFNFSGLLFITFPRASRRYAQHEVDVSPKTITHLSIHVCCHETKQPVKQPTLYHNERSEKCLDGDLQQYAELTMKNQDKIRIEKEKKNWHGPRCPCRHAAQLQCTAFILYNSRTVH